MIHIETQGYHRSEVNDDDLRRAEQAAQKALDDVGVSAAEAAAAYYAQWEEFDDEGPMTGVALAWIAARGAADQAITAGWANPAADVFCELTTRLT